MVRRAAFTAGLLPLAWAPAQPADAVPKWTRFETTFASARDYGNPLDTELRVTFRSPSGAERTVYGFWDGGRTWRVRFSPDETGQWRFTTACSDSGNRGLHARTGVFACGAPRAGNRFERHGPVRIAAGNRHFSHEDGTPFFWLADTAWNGPLLATDEDWDFYIQTRLRQRFTAVQWVATQWRGSPAGDRDGLLPYSGRDSIRVNPEFFRQLDRKSQALTRAGLLSVPVMLWAYAGGPDPEINPGISLPADQAILLARYMLARWGAEPVVWLINGDGKYIGADAGKWKQIGRGVFGSVWHAPVSLHPGGRSWPMDAFREETWLDICGYQSGHGDSPGNSRWITTGEPAREWRNSPPRPVISVEAPYERKTGKGAVTPEFLTRRNHLWSLLNAPVAGITYGAFGMWSWSDGVNPAPGHGPAVDPHWKETLEFPAARQMGFIREFFESIEFQRLEPAPGLIAVQPGTEAPHRFLSAARSAAGDIAVVYTPEDRELVLAPDKLPARFRATWYRPSDGRRAVAGAGPSAAGTLFRAPEPGDWLLLVSALE